MPIKVLYVGAANLAQPSAGMDLGSRYHFEELSDGPDLHLTAVAANPSIEPSVPARRPVSLLRSNVPPAGLVRKLSLLARGGILFQTGFISDEARYLLYAGLADRPDVLVIDHIAALANLSLFRLLATRLGGRTKIFVVAHDISSELLHDRARAQRSKLKAAAIHLHALHCHLYEAAVYALAHRVWFVSTDDRDRFRWVRRSKTDAMCQAIELPPAPSGPAEENGRYLIFVGSPSFFPNAFAIDWIVGRFAPALQSRLPDMRILLVGKGTERFTGANVTGLGFVDDDRLNRLLRAAAGTLSPVIHGAGIKIKVQEAIAAGCAIFATEPSLRGYEFMRLEPTLDVDDPDASAERVCAIAGDPARLAAYQAEIGTRWQEYRARRVGRLAETVRRLAC